MSRQVRQNLDELFSAKNLGGMRVYLFAKFYEDLLREYFNHGGYQVHSGKPRIFWNKILSPSASLGEKHTRLIGKLAHLQQAAVHCTPDGLFARDNMYFIWEAKNWVQKLFPSPFSDRIWDFAWLLAKQAEYKGRIYNLSGFIISWWEREAGMDESVEELRKYVHPLSVEVIITKEVVNECINAQYQWYIDLIENRRKNISEFFDVLVGKRNV